MDEGAEPNADMWATAEESRDRICGLYRRVAAHSDTVIDARPLDAIGYVPWWPPETSEVTLHKILVHTIAEAHRHAGHAGHADRELIDGSAGLLNGDDNIAPGGRTWWESHRARLELAAREVGSA